MATQIQPPNTPASVLSASTRSYRPFIGIFIGIGVALVAALTLLTIDHSNLWFPLTSAIAFPALAISPFLIMRLRIPLWLKVLIVGLIGLVLVPYLGLRDTDYLELA